MQKRLLSILPALIFIVLLVSSHLSTYNDLPRGMHAWGQADRYAISERYTQTGMKLLKISTYNMASENGRTGAELPLVQYAAAGISKLGFESHLPFLNKLLNLLIFAAGFFFFLRSFEFKSVWTKCFLVIFTLSSPVLMFYAFNFLPDVAGLGFILGGYAMLTQYRKTGSMSWIYLLLLIGTLGALIKLSSAIYLIASLAFVGFGLLVNKNYRRLIPLLIGSLLSVAIIAGYVKYFMIDVNEKYWSVVFRAHENPISSFTDLMDVIKGMAYWRTEYLSILGSIIFIVIAVILVTDLIKKRISFRVEGMLFHSLIVLLGLGAFMAVLGKQFIHHDYYFVSTFLPLILFTVFWFAKHRLDSLRIKTSLVKFLLTVPALLYFYSTPSKNIRRQGDLYKMRKHVLSNFSGWLEEAYATTEQLGLSEKSRIFVMYNQSPNLPLVHFNRTGMCFNTEEIQRDEPFVEFWAKKLEPDFFIFAGSREGGMFSLFKEDKPELAKNLELLHATERFTIYRRKVDWNTYLPGEQ